VKGGGRDIGSVNLGHLHTG
jgi:hypothetical protein